MVHHYLAAMGYTDPARVQQEAANSDLSCLIRFYSGEFADPWSCLLLSRPLVRSSSCRWFWSAAPLNRCSC